MENNTADFTSETLKWKMGLRASTTARLELKDVRVPRSNLLGEAGNGFKMALKRLDGARVRVAAQALGIAQRAFDESVNYAKIREQFGGPIGKLQAIQWMIADMSTRLVVKYAFGSKKAKLHALCKLYAVHTRYWRSQLGYVLDPNSV